MIFLDMHGGSLRYVVDSLNPATRSSGDWNPKAGWILDSKGAYQLILKIFIGLFTIGLTQDTWIVQNERMFEFGNMGRDNVIESPTKIGYSSSALSTT